MQFTSVPKVCIVKGTHRYEKTAHMLGDPLVDELRRHGIVGVLHNVPSYAADTSRDAPMAYEAFRKVRKRWWHTLKKSENCPIFTLHSYPCDISGRLAKYGEGKKLGEIPNGEGTFGVYLFEPISLGKRLQKDLIGTIKELVRIQQKGASTWEDGTLYHTHMIEVPAIPDRKDATGLTVDMDRTIAAGFTGAKVIEIVAKGIAATFMKEIDIAEVEQIEK